MGFCRFLHLGRARKTSATSRSANVVLLGAALAAVLSLSTPGRAQENLPPLDIEAQSLVQRKSISPYDPTPLPVVEKMLEMANLRPGETLYDLGSGDGRMLILAAQKFGARAVGIELDPRWCALARQRIAKLGLEQSARVIEGDMLEQDLSSADVITIYLTPAALEKLEPRLAKYAHVGLRVVINEDQIPGWKPTLTARVSGGGRRSYTVTLYELPHAHDWTFFSSFGAKH